MNFYLQSQGSRAPQVFTLYGSAAEHPEASNLAGWTRLADVDTRPNQTGQQYYLAMEMTGDNHGPPSVVEVERLRQQAARSLPGVQVRFGTLDDFARAVMAENPELPLVRADMPDTWIHGWLSMPLEAKANRQCRALEPALDALDTQIRAWGFILQ
jgi:alpha-mannosidase